jgi:hypothetical protein
MVANCQRALDLDATILILNSAQALCEVEEGNSLEELVYLTVADAEQSRAEEFI